MRSLLIIFSILIAILAGFSQAQAAILVDGNEGYADGYVSDVSKERSEKFYEIYIFASPPPKQKSLQDAIFNQTLSKEFRDKYREKFGQIDTESIVYQKNNFNMIDKDTTLSTSAETENSERRAFAEYMTKRLVEFHVDNYFKNDPTMRPIYEAKQKISNVEVKVGTQVKMNIRYEFAGNTLDLIIKNPWCDAKVALEMDPSSFGPSNVEETRVWLGKDINTKLRINTNAALVDGIGTVEFVRKITPMFAGFFTVSSYFKDGDAAVKKQLDTFGAATIRESRGFVGFSHTF